MLEIVRQTIKKFRLVESGIVVVGVSGGADSLVLLHTLHQLAPRIGISVHAATLDHTLRGEESAGDVRFVELICQEWGIPVSVGQADVRTIARDNQLGIEAAARLARYDFLAEVAQTVGSFTIAVAHHADDQAETVLMHLLRGAGVHGLSGMALKSQVNGHGNVTLIRPLLRVTRAEIDVYCEQHHFEPRHDSTNDDRSLLRNGIRLDVLPVLKRYSPHLSAALVRFAEIAAVEDDYLDQQVQDFAQSEAVLVADQRISIKRSAFRGLHPALQRRMVLWALGKMTHTENISSQLILEAVEVGLRGKQGALALLGSGWRVRVAYESIYVEYGDAPTPETAMPLLSEDYAQQIDVPSIIKLGRYDLQVSLRKPLDAELFCQLAIPAGVSVVLRTRKTGDIFSPLGMNGHRQKLNRWFSNAKVPQLIRSRIPVIVVNESVAAIYVNDKWIIGESFAVRNTLTRIIYFQFLENS